MALTLNEFKCWLEGFEESFSGVYGTGHPNKDQWAKIKAKLGEVEPVQPYQVQDLEILEQRQLSRLAVINEGNTNV